MKTSRYTQERIAFALSQSEGGAPVADVSQQMGVSEARLYARKKRYNQPGLTETQEIHQLRDENARQKRLATDLTLNNHISREVISKNSDSRPASRAGGLNQRAL